jgi:hypothetical protein
MASARGKAITGSLSQRVQPAWLRAKGARHRTVAGPGAADRNRYDPSSCRYPAPPEVRAGRWKLPASRTGNSASTGLPLK